MKRDVGLFMTLGKHKPCNDRLCFPCHWELRIPSIVHISDCQKRLFSPLATDYTRPLYIVTHFSASIRIQTVLHRSPADRSINGRCWCRSDISNTRPFKAFADGMYSTFPHGTYHSSGKTSSTFSPCTFPRTHFILLLIHPHWFNVKCSLRVGLCYGFEPLSSDYRGTHF